MDPLRILLADDSEPVLELMRHILSVDGHTVKTVTSGSQALKVMEREQFDLVIADVIMPDGDGFELVGELRERFPNTKTLVISGGSVHFTPRYCTETAKKLGAHAGLSKPFNRERLLASIDAAMKAPD